MFWHRYPFWLCNLLNWGYILILLYVLYICMTANNPNSMDSKMSPQTFPEINAILSVILWSVFKAIYFIEVYNQTNWIDDKKNSNRKERKHWTWSNVRKCIDEKHYYLVEWGHLEFKTAHILYSLIGTLSASFYRANPIPKKNFHLFSVALHYLSKGQLWHYSH